MKVYKIFSNVTWLNGTLIRIPDDRDVQQTTTEVPNDSYDAQGAMQFIIATVLVYSIIGVFCTLCLRIKRIHGKGHQSYLQDESVAKYLKTEDSLKLDGKKMKWMQECHMLKERLKLYEEKQRLLELEKEITGDFGTPVADRKHFSKRKKRSKKKGELQSAISKIGVSLLYVGSKPAIGADDIGNTSDDSVGIEMHVRTECPCHSKDQESSVKEQSGNKSEDNNNHSDLDTNC